MNSFRWLTSSLVVLVLAFVSLPAFAQVSISVDIAPPPLVVETQPACPDDGLLWTPGYWAYDNDAGVYYWVPGAWEQPPEVGLYWTPAYWSWDGNAYVYNEGYWGPTVGFYGGVNYGHGYWGNGYGGGRWDNGHFAYNTAANNVRGGHVHNTYADRSMVVRSGSNRVSYNGGQGGIPAQPTPQQQAVAQQNRIPATAQQQAHFQTAAQTRSHQVKVNAHATTAGNSAAPAANQPQVSQQPAAQPQTHPASGPLNGSSNPQEKPAASAPAVNKQAEALTGGDTEAQRKEPVAEKNVAPANPKPATAAINPAKMDNQPHVAEQAAPAKPAAPVNQPKMDDQPHVAQQPAPQVHATQGPGPAPSLVHDTHVAAAPEVHPQAAPAAAKPEVKADGQGKPDDQSGGH